MDNGFLLVVIGATMTGMIAFVSVVSWLRLPGRLSLYLAFFITLLIRNQIKK